MGKVESQYSDFLVCVCVEMSFLFSVKFNKKTGFLEHSSKLWRELMRPPVNKAGFSVRCALVKQKYVIVGECFQTSTDLFI